MQAALADAISQNPPVEAFARGESVPDWIGNAVMRAMWDDLRPAENEPTIEHWLQVYAPSPPRQRRKTRVGP